MKFFQKPGVAVVFTIVMIAAALFIGLSPVLKSDKPAETAQTAVPEQTISQTPAEEQTSNTAGDETISDKYIRDDAGLFTRSGESAIQDYNKKIYSRTGSHIAILTTDGTGGKTLESCTNSAFDSMGLSEYDMLFAIDTSTEQWYVTTGSYVADYTDSKLESIFQDGFAAILDGDADDAADTMYEDLYSWCKTSLNGAANEEYTPVQETGRVRRKSIIGTIITILVIFWIIKAIFGSGRRGGGGYILITRADSKSNALMSLINSIGDEIDERTARAHLSNANYQGLLDKKTAMMMSSCILENNYKGLDHTLSAEIRARQLKQMLLAYIN